MLKLKPELAKLFRAGGIGVAVDAELIRLLNGMPERQVFYYIVQRVSIHADQLQRRISEFVFACDEAVSLIKRGAPDNAVVILEIAIQREKERKPDDE